MKKIYTLAAASLFATALNAQTAFFTPTTYKGAFPVTDNTTATDWTSGWANWDPENTVYGATTTIVSSDITTNTTWTTGTIVNLQNKVFVKNNAVLTIQPGVIIRGDKATQGTLIIAKGAKIIAAGTANNPIVFTSGEAVGNRAEGDWGGVLIAGKGKNNQPGGVANFEGLAVSTDTEYGGTDDTDSSGVFTYCRIEFSGIPLQPNKETNGITFGSVGSKTVVHHVQVSFGGDDGFEWFGGTVDAKYIISFRNLDDDFDADFGWRGRVQFGLIIKDADLSDAAGDSNGFETDNDATGSGAFPRTQALFSNITNVGPKRNGASLPVGEKFERAVYIRRNSALSIFNSIHTSWEKGVYIKDAGTVDNFTTNDSAVFANNLIAVDAGKAITTDATASQSFYNTIFTSDNNDSTKTISQIAWVNAFPTALNSAPDFRLQNSSVAATGASFTDAKFAGQLISVGLGNSNELLNNVTLFPNPAQNEISLSVDLSSISNVKINIYDVTGKLINTVADANTNSNIYKIDISNLPAGLYFATINANEASKTLKFVVTK